VIPWLADDEQPLPPSSQALGAGSDAPGLLAASGELTQRRLAEAYAHGVFPWYSAGQPVLWWAPDPRMVLFTCEFRVSRSLRKTIARFARSPACELRIDSALRRVMQACARTPRPGQSGTWIVPEMVAAYAAWPAVHSFETWVGGELVGGLYGVSLGRMFFGESMFSLQTDASKIALAALVCFGRASGIDLIDCQQRTGHLASLGAREVSRVAFERLIGTRLKAMPVREWSYDPAHWDRLRTTAGEPTSAGTRL
jgi:leucyl/phenylalanyl-tRNA--protein transferase